MRTSCGGPVDDDPARDRAAASRSAYCPARVRSCMVDDDGEAVGTARAGRRARAPAAGGRRRGRWWARRAARAARPGRGRGRSAPAGARRRTGSTRRGRPARRRSRWARASCTAARSARPSTPSGRMCGVRPEQHVVGDGDPLGDRPATAARGRRAGAAPADAASRPARPSRWRSPAPRTSAGEVPQERRLAGAVRPDDRQPLPAADVEVDAVEDAGVAEVDGDARARRSSPSPLRASAGRGRRTARRRTR